MKNMRSFTFGGKDFQDEVSASSLVARLSKEEKRYLWEALIQDSARAVIRSYIEFEASMSEDEIEWDEDDVSKITQCVSFDYDDIYGAMEEAIVPENAVDSVGSIIVSYFSEKRKD